jgi:hypothetical protein
MRILPPAPLRLKRSFVVSNQIWSILLMLIGLFIPAGYGYWQLDEVEHIQRDAEVYASGVPTEDGSVNGSVRSRYFIFRDYNLDVNFVDAQGKRHAEKLSFSTLGSGIDEEQTPELRYDPADPSRYAVSWAVESSGGRWASVIFFTLGGMVIGFAVGYLGWAMRRNLRDARSVAERGEEVACRVLSAVPQVVNGRETDNIIYRVSVPAPPAAPSWQGAYRDPMQGAPPAAPPVEREIVLNRKTATPLFLDARGAVVLALVTPDAERRFVAMRDDLHPFTFTDDESTILHQRLAAVRANPQAYGFAPFSG